MSRPTTTHSLKMQTLSSFAAMILGFFVEWAGDLGSGLIFSTLALIGALLILGGVIGALVSIIRLWLSKD